MPTDTVDVMSLTPAFSAPAQVFRAVELDASQRAVCELGIRESASVLGAPGSGKTSTLIEYVASRVEKFDMSADHILVLTPQRLAANRLRLALGERLQVATNGPLARTPMSVAFSLATEGALARGVEPPRMLTGAEQDKILADLLKHENRGVTWPAELGLEVRQSRIFRTELRDLFARATEMGVSPESLRVLGVERDMPAWVAAADFWLGEYEDALALGREEHFDIATLMRQAAVALADPAVMSGVRLVVVDDAQELTVGAIEILRQFAARGVPVVVFGDPDETATTFRDATPSVLGAFAEMLGAPARTFELSSVYRHGGAVRDLVSDVVGRTGVNRAGTQRAAKVAPSLNDAAGQSTLSVMLRGSRASESAAIARRLREFHIHHNIDFAKMAVIVRSGRDVPDLARSLAVAEVPTRTLVSDRTLNDQAISRDLLRVVSVAIGMRSIDPSAAIDMLTSPLVGLSIIEVRRLRQALRHDELAAGGKRTGEQLLPLAVAGEVPVAGFDMRAARRLTALVELLTTLRALKNATIEELLWEVWSNSGLAKTWGEESAGTGVIADEANRNLDAVLALFTAARRFVEREPSRRPQDFIATVLASEVPEDTLASQSEADAVLVCTPAAVIGAEFDVVVVASVQDGAWPNLRLRSSLLHANALTREKRDLVDERKDVLDDELRMFALAISRARNHLVVSSRSGGDEVESPIVRLAIKHLVDGEISVNRADSPEQYPLSLRGMVGHLRRELSAELREHPEGNDRARNRAAALAALGREGVAGAYPETWLGLIDPSTKDNLSLNDGSEAELVHVSPSSLEKWEDNQLSWFIDRTVGWQGGSSAGIGTLVHAVFERSFRDPSMSLEVEDMWQQIEPQWSELAITPEWESERSKVRVKKMLAGLADYIRDFNASGRTVVDMECSIAINLEGGKLSGRVDRLEQLPDGSIEIVDLKTSKYALSAKEGEEHLQLACYQFALVNGGFAEVTESTGAAGAKLLYLNKDKGDVFTYREVTQTAFEPEGSDRDTGTPRSAAQMRELIQTAIEGMGGSTFSAVVFTREVKGEFDSAWSKRIHVIQAVTA